MPAFKKQHYELVAQVLRTTQPVAPVDDPLYQTGGFTFVQHKRDVARWENVCLAFLNHFRQDNPQFDSDRFLVACKGKPK